MRIMSSSTTRPAISVSRVPATTMFTVRSSYAFSTMRCSRSCAAARLGSSAAIAVQPLIDRAQFLAFGGFGGMA